MDSIKNESCGEALSEKKAYESPRAMRLGDMRNGAGDCIASGSGDGIICQGSGNSAAGICFASGSNVRL
jgi:hypothetical protein